MTPSSHAFVRRLLAATLLVSGSACATIPETSAPRPGVSASVLPEPEREWATLRGLARLSVAGPAGSGSASQAVLVALPDRGRIESLTPLGTTAAVVVVAGDEVRYHSVVNREYATGRATRETLERLIGIPVPPGPLLRLLAGLPPLPVRLQDPRTQVSLEGGVQRVESVEGLLWQRIHFPTPPAAGAVRGELGDAGGPVLHFAWEAWRAVGEVMFPHTLRLAGGGREARLDLTYEWVRLGEALDPSLFVLPRPTEPGLRVVEFGEGPALRPAP